MFENAGSKIQTLAKVVCVLGIIISVIAGIMILSGGTALRYYGASMNVIITGLLTIVIGSLASWINALLLYALGSLVENVASIKAGMALRSGETTKQ